MAASEADDVVSVFRALYAAGFPIEEMRLTSLDELDLPPTGDGNNTGAYVCRPTTGQTSGFSAHAYGLALDLDPFQNPYLKGDLVLPELAGSYLDRDRVRPGHGARRQPRRARVRPDRVVVGRRLQHACKDYQHFTATGR